MKNSTVKSELVLKGIRVEPVTGIQVENPKLPNAEKAYLDNKGKYSGYQSECRRRFLQHQMMKRREQMKGTPLSKQHRGENKIAYNTFGTVQDAVCTWNHLDKLFKTEEI